jgi:signal transduction histidine kinase
MNSERKTTLLRKINDESDRLARLINDLLDLSRIESGSMSWRSEPVSLSEIVQASVDAMMPLALNKGVVLSQSTDGALRGLIGDRDRLLQVMTNLLSNAVKFTPAGGSITVTACREEVPSPRFVVTVRDTGAGVAADDLPHIFEKFRRGHSVEGGAVEGSGLGLAISSQIVEHYGGTIQAASVFGAGSTFTVILPADRGTS